MGKVTEYSLSAQGMLGIGAALLGSSHVIGVDIDSDALETAQGNLESFKDVQASQHPQPLSSVPVHRLWQQNKHLQLLLDSAILYVGAEYVAGRNVPLRYLELMLRPGADGIAAV